MTTSRFLQNVRVVDLSQYIPGPFATRQLADLGADVIKIEPPGGDPMRNFMHADDNSVSPIYRHVNRGKRICQLDLKSESGKQCFAELLSAADILLESFRPGVLARLGFDRERLDRINPRLIHCALSGYGQNGPYQFRAGHDVNYCAGSSILMTGSQQPQPGIGFPPLADHAAALQASIAMLAALQGGDRQSGGTYLDISLFETSLSWQYLPLLGGSTAHAVDILSGGAACYNVYQCADGLYLSLGALETAFWENFCTALEKPQWISRQFETMPQRELIAEVAQTIATRPRVHWHRLLDTVDCCYEALYFPDELPDHPQICARASLTEQGPAYPGWIDGQPVDIADDFEEIESPDKLDWL